MSDFRFVSLGAGVQSTVMLLMGMDGLFGEPPDAAIFADTGWEPKQVYEHLAWLETQVDIPIYRVTDQDRNLYDDTLSGYNHDGKPYTDIPAFVRKSDGSKGIGNRQCTRFYKIRPVERKMRELAGRKRGARSGPTIEQWIGISLDEIIRIKPASRAYITNRWPLIEQKLTRQDCLDWFHRVYPGRPLVKSSCIGCPFHSDKQWLEMADQDPEGMQKAIELDAQLRVPDRPSILAGGPEEYLHSSLMPLGDALDKLRRIAAEGSQLSLLDGYGNECAGVCEV